MKWAVLAETEEAAFHGAFFLSKWKFSYKDAYIESKYMESGDPIFQYILSNFCRIRGEKSSVESHQKLSILQELSEFKNFHYGYKMASTCILGCQLLDQPSVLSLS